MKFMFNDLVVLLYLVVLVLLFYLVHSGNVFLKVIIQYFSIAVFNNNYVLLYLVAL